MLLYSTMVPGNTFFRTALVPLLLMILSPPAILLVCVICYHYDGSVTQCFRTSFSNLYSNFPTPTREGAALSIGFLLSQLILLVVIPGRKFVAVPTPTGNRPRYKLNGLLCFVITHVVLLLVHHKGLIRYSALYDNFGGMLSFLSRSALVATVLLYLRGIYMPTNSDSGATVYGFVWDLWHGTELHPEIMGVSLKQLINCRFAMMGWSVAIISFLIKQRELYGHIANSMVVSTILQMCYIAKFFLWEGGYFNSIDIIHDRFGFYIFWGCTAFLPSIYTLPSYYLTTHPVEQHPLVSLLTLTIGLLSLIFNYWTDRQRQHFRSTNGETKIFGEVPRIIKAKYITGDGVERTSLLLASGWWGMARHINYFFEIILAFMWSSPAGISAMAYVYVAFLTVLLFDRAYRDEIRCFRKYGDGYRKYCKVVVWKIIPGIY